MALADLGDLLAAKRVLVRVDFNVPLDDAGPGSPTTAASPPPCRPSGTCSTPGRAIVMSHLGQPEGRPAPTARTPFRMDRVAERLRELLGRPVTRSMRWSAPAVRRRPRS